MKQMDLSSLTDQELLQEAKRRKWAAFGDALFIGLLVGIVWFSVIKNSIGFFTLLPVIFIYKLIKRPKYDSRQLQARL